MTQEVAVRPRPVAALDRDKVLTALTPPSNLKAQVMAVGPGTRIITGVEGVGIRFGSKTLTVAPDALARMFGEVLKIPKEIVDDAPPHLVLPLANHLLQQKERLVTTTQGDVIVNVARAGDKGFVPVEPERLLKLVERGLPGAKYQMAIMTPKGWEGDVVAVSEERDVRVIPGKHTFLPEGGELFRAGVHLRFSPFGTVQPMVEPYEVRLVCLNGAIHAEYVSQFGKGYGEGDTVWQFFRQGIRETQKHVKAIMDKYRHMAEEVIKPGELAGMVEGMIRQGHLGDKMANAFKAQVMDRPPKTMYDLYNHLTDVASHVDKDVVRTLRAMTGAGAVADAESHRRICPTCRH